MHDFQRQFVLALLAYGVQRDLDPRRLCDLSGFNYKELGQKSHSVLTAGQKNQLWKNAVHLSNDSLFGLHFGESMQLAALGVVGQIIQTSSTAGEALTNACSLTHLITNMFEMRLSHANKAFKVNIIFDEDKADRFPFTFRQMADYLMVFVVHELNGLLLQKVSPLEARFPYALPEAAEYTRIFCCPLPLKSKELSLKFSTSLLEYPILSAKYELQNHLLQQIGALRNNEVKGRGLHARIYNYLLANSYLHASSMEAVAANFNLSTRSMQRKLKEEDVTYLHIVQEVRKKLATSYLTAANHSLKDISNILGYNEQSAFVRAFKRWSNKTPTEFQNKNRWSNSSL